MKHDITGGAAPVQVLEAAGFVARQATIQVRTDAPAAVYIAPNDDEANEDDGIEINPGDTYVDDLSDGDDLWVFAVTTTSFVLTVR